MKTLTQMTFGLVAVLVLAGCDPAPGPSNTAKAVDDNATVVSGQSVTIDVLANDEDTSGIRNPTKWIRSATQPVHGTVVVDKNSTIIYTADANFTGTDTFTYTLSIYDMTDEADVTVTVTPAAQPPVALPVAEAGTDKTITKGETLELNGTCSIATGKIESCNWYEGETKLENQEALRGGIVPGKQSIRLRYTPSTVGVHTLKLVAIDGNGKTASDEVNVTVTAATAANQPPTADAGEDKSVVANEFITLNGTCTDPEGKLASCVWKEGSNVLVSNGTLNYSSDEIGVHTLTLTATDDEGATATDEVNITVTAAVIANRAPTANAGENKSVVAGESITLTGSCTDSDGTIASCVWKEGTQTLASNATFDYSSNDVGVHTLTLIATDDKGAIATDEVNITVTAATPAAYEKVFFEWDDGVHGIEPWVSDGTVDGTKMLKDIAPEGNNSSPEFSTVVINAETFFAATSGDKFDRELWKTDGTTDGTVRVVDIATEEGHGSHPHNLCKIDNMLYFLALDGNTSDSNNWDGNKSLWKSTGEIGNATKVENFGDFSNSSYSAPGYLRAVGDKLLFQKDYDAGNGANWNPWVSDGTNPAVRVAGDTFKGAYDSFSWNGVVYQGKYYTSANDRATGDEVWVWDYAHNTASLLMDINDDGTKGSYPDNFIVAGDKLYFTATNARSSGDPEAYDASLWVSDGNQTNTVVVKDDEATPPSVGTRNRFVDMTVMDGALYFCYLRLDEHNNTIGVGTLWHSDGTKSGTTQIKDINVTSGSLKATDDTLFFWVWGDASDQGVWISKGDEASTHRVKAFGTNVYIFDNFVKDGLYYFILDNVSNGKRELWRTDGTEEGTIKLVDKTMPFG